MCVLRKEKCIGEEVVDLFGWFFLTCRLMHKVVEKEKEF